MANDPGELTVADWERIQTALEYMSLKTLAKNRYGGMPDAYRRTQERVQKAKEKAS